MLVCIKRVLFDVFIKLTNCFIIYFPMKKSIMFALFALSVTFIMAGPEDNDGDTSLANPYTICLSDKGNNTGRCKERVDGYGSSCVKAGILQSKNCYDDMIKPEV